MYTYDNFLGRIRSLENCKQHGSFCCFEVQGPAQDGEVNIPHPPSKPAIAHVPHGTALQRFRFRVKEMEGSSWATYWDDPDATGMNNGLSYLRLTAAQKAQVQNGTYDGRSAFLDYANWYQHAAFDQYSALEESKASAEARKGVCISFSLEWILRILYHRESNLTRLNKVKGQLKRVEARQVRFVNPIYDARDNQMHHDLALAAEVVVCRCRQCLARQADERKRLDNKYYAGLRQVGADRRQDVPLVYAHHFPCEVAEWVASHTDKHLLLTFWGADWGHAVAFRVPQDESPDALIVHFDPNFGEYAVPRKWFCDYMVRYYYLYYTSAVGGMMRLFAYEAGGVFRAKLDQIIAARDGLDKAKQSTTKYSTSPNPSSPSPPALKVEETKVHGATTAPLKYKKGFLKELGQRIKGRYPGK